MNENTKINLFIQSLIRICAIIFLVISVLIVRFAAFSFSPVEGEYQSAHFAIRLILVLSSVVFVFFLIKSLTKLFAFLYTKCGIYLVISIFSIIFLIQLLLVIFSRNSLSYDSLKVFDEALSMLHTGGISPVDFDSYFTRYTNNYPMVFLTYYILKASSIIGVLARDYSNALLIVQIFNIIAVDFSFIFGLLIIKQFLNKKALFYYLSIIFLCPLTYIWVPFYYTNTISFPFYMGSIFFCLIKYKKNMSKYLGLAMAGLLCGAGFYIRATQIIFFIALVGCVCLKVMNDLLLNKELDKKSLFKKIIFNICLFIFGILIAYSMQHISAKKYVHFDTTDTAFPAIHWIMMGTHVNGEFYQKDEFYTRSFQTKEEKVSGDFELLKNRIKIYGKKGIAKTYYDKIMNTFGDGTGNFQATLSMSEKYGKVYQAIYGSKRNDISYYCQVVYLLLLLLSIGVGINQLLDPKLNVAFLFMVSMIGAYLFYMIWEAGTIYSIGFIPVLYVLAVSSFESNKVFSLINNDKYCNFINRIKKCKANYIIVIISAFIVIFVGNQYINKSIDKNYIIKQFMFTFNDYVVCNKDNKLDQSFSTVDDFDQFEVFVHNDKGTENDSIYEFDLCDDNGQILESCIVNGSDCQDMEFLSLPFHNIDHVINYDLKIEKIGGNNDLSFGYYGTGNWDIYKGGELKGNTVSPLADLTMRAYSYNE